MYEIWSVGHKPFEEVANVKVYTTVTDLEQLYPWML